MGEQVQNRVEEEVVEVEKLSRPWQKFLIGFVGGLTAAIFPRITAALTMFSGEDDLIVISMDYFLLAVFFGVLVGLVMMILEWGILKEPKATFMAALGLPALLTGALNTSNGAYVLDNQARENKELIELAERKTNIQEVPSIQFEPLSGLSNNGMDGSTKLESSRNIFGINVAYAAGVLVAETETSFNPAIQVRKDKYYIVLERVSSKKEAIERESTLSEDIPSAKAVKAGDQFYIIYPKALTRSKAIIKASKFQDKYGVTPQLMKK